MTEIRHILCPIDFSATSRHALEHALAVARWYDLLRKRDGTAATPSTYLFACNRK